MPAIGWLGHQPSADGGPRAGARAHRGMFHISHRLILQSRRLSSYRIGAHQPLNTPAIGWLGHQPSADGGPRAGARVHRGMLNMCHRLIFHSRWLRSYRISAYQSLNTPAIGWLGHQPSADGGPRAGARAHRGMLNISHRLIFHPRRLSSYRIGAYQSVNTPAIGWLGRQPSAGGVGWRARTGAC